MMLSKNYSSIYFYYANQMNDEAALKGARNNKGGLTLFE